MIVLSEVSAPASGVRLQQPQVTAWFENDSAGDGTLTVAESSVTWICRTTGKGFSLSYPSIILHAVSTDLSTFPQECVYVLVDATRAATRPRQPAAFLTAEEAQQQQNLNLAEEELNGEDSDGDDEPKNVSIRFVPADSGILQEVYQEMCKCQELNPDSGDDFSEDDMGEEGMMQMGGEMPQGNWFTAANLQNAELSEEGLANLQRMMGGGENGHGNGHHNGHDDDDDEMED